MTDINNIFLIGRLTKDPKLENFNNNSKLTISIANNKSFKKGDAWENQSSFFDVVAGGTMADRLISKLVKGDTVAISGRLKQDRWEKDGQKQSRIYIVADTVQPCTPSSINNNQPSVQTGSVAQPMAAAFDNPDDIVLF